MIKRPPNVAIVRLHGVIGLQMKSRELGLNLANLEDPLERAFNLPRLKAVALDINSPGGSPVESSKIYRRIRSLSEQKEVPVYSFASDVAASGGYWLACAGDEIFAEDSSVVGSIGVISAGFGFKQVIEKLGVERRIYTVGKSKSMLDPFLDEKADDVRHLHKIQESIHDAFKDLVRMARVDKIQNEDEIFSGAFWTGRQAKLMGLVDGLGEMRIILQEKFGTDINFRIMNPPRPKRWWNMTQHSRLSIEELVDEGVNALEARSTWSKYGL